MNGPWIWLSYKRIIVKKILKNRILVSENLMVVECIFFSFRMVTLCVTGMFVAKDYQNMRDKAKNKVIYFICTGLYLKKLK